MCRDRLIDGPKSGDDVVLHGADPRALQGVDHEEFEVERRPIQRESIAPDLDQADLVNPARPGDDPNMFVDVRLEPTAGLVAPQAMIVSLLILPAPRGHIDLPTANCDANRDILTPRRIAHLRQGVEQGAVDRLERIAERRRQGNENVDVSTAMHRRSFGKGTARANIDDIPGAPAADNRVDRGLDAAHRRIKARVHGVPRQHHPNVVINPHHRRRV